MNGEGMLNHSVTFSLGSAKVCSSAIFLLSQRYMDCWKTDYCIPGRKSGILRIQYSHAAAAAEISFGRDNLKNVLVRTFKFGMWVYMANATNAIVL